METDITNVTTAPEHGPGNNDVDTAGADTQTAQPGAPKTFTQEALNEIVKARLAEKERSLRSKFEKDLEAQLTAVREEAQKNLDKLIEERVTARLAEQELNRTRAALMTEYNLSEEQAARLQGTTPEELSKDAETIYGAFKQLPKIPVIRTGAEGNGGSETAGDISKMSPAEIRKNRDQLWKQVRVP